MERYHTGIVKDDGISTLYSQKQFVCLVCRVPWKALKRKLQKQQVLLTFYHPARRRPL